jgi:hypothetical protein
MSITDRVLISDGKSKMILEARKGLSDSSEEIFKSITYYSPGNGQVFCD